MGHTQRHTHGRLDVFAGPMAEIPRDRPLECLFLRIDEDNSGTIEFSEFHAWATAWHYVKMMTCDYQETMKALGMTGDLSHSQCGGGMVCTYAYSGDDAMAAHAKEIGLVSMQNGESLGMSDAECERFFEEPEPEPEET